MDKIYCKCGCGELIERFNKWGYEKKYATSGHSFRGRHHTIAFRKKLSALNTKNYRLNSKIKYKYFDSLTPKGAYIIGYLFADGCLSLYRRKNKDSHRISFSSIDEELVEKISKELNISYNKRIRKSGFSNIGSPIYHSAFRDANLIKYLKIYGMKERKAKRLKLPKLLKMNFFFDFLRGFFDGDGCFYILNSFDRKYNYLKGSFSIYSLSKDFLISIQDTLRQYSIFSRIKKHSSRDFYSLIVARFDDLKLLYSFLYKNSDNLYLSRKKNKFEYYLKNKKRGKIDGKFTDDVRKKISLSLKNRYLNDSAFRVKMLITNRRNGKLRKGLSLEKHLSLFKT